MANTEEQITEIIRDLNVTIADTETALGELSNDKTENEFKRAIGQLKAARASLIEARRVGQTVTSERS